MGTPVLQTEGMARVAELAIADASHIAVGTGTNTPVVGDTQLQEETKTSPGDETIAAELTKLEKSHKDFRINIRALEASRKLGQTLDTTMVGLATRLVTERLETILFNGLSL